MHDELGRYYELLGVRPGASAQELKEAYRDLAKVWHPDRFSHDPRLQQKAQEKLKEVNEAYERLSSGRAASRPRPAPAPPPAPEPRMSADETVAAAADIVARQRKRPKVFLPTALVFCAAFVAALYALVPSGMRRAPERARPAAHQEAEPSDKAQPQPEAATRADANQSARGKEKEKESAGRRPPAEAPSGDAPAQEPSARQLRPMPTVTVSIDASNGMLATRDCPNVSTLTYPKGNEPRQYCTVQHKTKIVPREESSASKDSRVKSIGKRLVAPFN